ncbi:MAG: hypothetical protein Q9196_005627 [Gyalolechia fulgens]
MAQPPQDTSTYCKSLTSLHAIFQNFSLVIDELIEDTANHRICMWLSARADTAAGEYVNEYVWLLDFDESGRKILRTKEFSDSVMARDFFPKLKEAMEKQRASKASGEKGKYICDIEHLTLRDKIPRDLRQTQILLAITEYSGSLKLFRA